MHAKLASLPWPRGYMLRPHFSCGGDNGLDVWLSCTRAAVADRIDVMAWPANLKLTRISYGRRVDMDPRTVQYQTYSNLAVQARDILV